MHTLVHDVGTRAAENAKRSRGECASSVFVSCCRVEANVAQRDWDGLRVPPVIFVGQDSIIHQPCMQLIESVSRCGTLINVNDAVSTVPCAGKVPQEIKAYGRESNVYMVHMRQYTA